MTKEELAWAGFISIGEGDRVKCEVCLLKCLGMKRCLRKCRIANYSLRNICPKFDPKFCPEFGPKFCPKFCPKFGTKLGPKSVPMVLILGSVLRLDTRGLERERRRLQRTRSDAAQLPFYLAAHVDARPPKHALSVRPAGDV